MPDTPPHPPPASSDAPDRAAAAGAAAARLDLCRPLRRHLEACLADLEGLAARLRLPEYVHEAVAWLTGLRPVLTDACVQSETDVGLARRLVQAIGTAGLPQVRGLDLAAYATPSAAVGGDIARVLRVDDGHLVIFVLDASGQGLPGAVVSVWATLELTRHAFSAAGRPVGPRALLDQLNRRLLSRPGGRYLRAFVADLDLDLMEMTYVNASHCEPLWLRGDRTESVDTQGLFVGLFEDAEYEEKTLRLSEGEMLLFYSDAVVDALRDRARLVEPAGLLAVVEDHRRRAAGRPSIRSLVDSIVHEALEHNGRRFADDVVILGLQCTHIEHWNSLAIPSDPHEAKRIGDAILEHLTLAGFGQRAIFATKLALEEALTNGIKHGNRSDPAKRLHVRYTICPDRVIITIADEGPGFDPSHVPDPTTDEHLEMPTGRGIMLMRHYMSGVEYNDVGNQVKLTRLNE
jgi:serine/threonine-protein kinase RsbW